MSYLLSLLNPGSGRSASAGYVSPQSVRTGDSTSYRPSVETSSQLASTADPDELTPNSDEEIDELADDDSDDGDPMDHTDMSDIDDDDDDPPPPTLRPVGNDFTSGPSSGHRDSASSGDRAQNHYPPSASDDQVSGSSLHLSAPKERRRLEKHDRKIDLGLHDHKAHADCPDTLACLPDTNGRPQHTLPVILRCAILGSPRKRLTIREIYATMETKYPYYKTAGQTWKQSVRHHLSLNRLFERQPRPVTDPGFGSYWTVNLTAPPGTKRPRKRGRPHRDSDSSGKKSNSVKDTSVTPVETQPPPATGQILPPQKFQFQPQTHPPPPPPPPTYGSAYGQKIISLARAINHPKSHQPSTIDPPVTIQIQPASGSGPQSQSQPQTQPQGYPPRRTHTPSKEQQPTRPQDPRAHMPSAAPQPVSARGPQPYLPAARPSSSSHYRSPPHRISHSPSPPPTTSPYDHYYGHYPNHSTSPSHSSSTSRPGASDQVVHVRPAYPHDAPRPAKYGISTHPTHRQQKPPTPLTPASGREGTYPPSSGTEDNSRFNRRGANGPTISDNDSESEDEVMHDDPHHPLGGASGVGPVGAGGNGGGGGGGPSGSYLPAVVTTASNHDNFNSSSNPNTNSPSGVAPPPFMSAPSSGLKNSTEELIMAMRSEIERLRQVSADAVATSIRLSEQLANANLEVSRSREAVRDLEDMLQDETNRRIEAERPRDSDRRRMTEISLRSPSTNRPSMTRPS